MLCRRNVAAWASSTKVLDKAAQPGDTNTFPKFVLDYVPQLRKKKPTKVEVCWPLELVNKAQTAVG